MPKDKKDKIKENKTTVKEWGTEERFKDLKKSKSKSNMIVPGAGTYEIIAKWPGKKDKKAKDNDKKNWMNGITKGI